MGEQIDRRRIEARGPLDGARRHEQPAPLCDERGTQIACDDDVTCAESSIGGPCSGVEVRESRIETHLAAGTYYIVADAFAYSTERVTMQAFWLAFTENIGSYEWFENYVANLEAVTLDAQREGAGRQVGERVAPL